MTNVIQAFFDDGEQGQLNDWARTIMAGLPDGGFLVPLTRSHRETMIALAGDGEFEQFDHDGEIAFRTTNTETGQ